MKIVSIVLVLILLIAAPLTLWAAEEGAALYKSKCAMCHGDKGEGKAAIKMPGVQGTNLTAEQITVLLTKGESGKKTPHSGAVSGLDEAQAKAVAEHVKTLK